MRNYNRWPCFIFCLFSSRCRFTLLLFSLFIRLTRTMAMAYTYLHRRNLKKQYSPIKRTREKRAQGDSLQTFSSSLSLKCV
ncbi:hypothetical protein HDV63DRAFT_365527 [Trichoderma sp. SZMC 28014]